MGTQAIVRDRLVNLQCCNGKTARKDATFLEIFSKLLTVHENFLEKTKTSAFRFDVNFKRALL